jgi:Cu+-exporting ATPase
MSVITKSILGGLGAAIALLGLYFAVVTLISGLGFAGDQFAQYWYFISGLAAGFGVQVGLYLYLRGAIRERASKGMMAVSGTISAGAMLSCCAHYLVNILPVIGISGVAAFIGHYQVELFWVGIAFNVAGIAYIGRKVLSFNRV